MRRPCDAPRASPRCGRLTRTAWRALRDRASRGPGRAAGLVLGLFLPLAAQAEEQERFDHRGALGLLLGGGVDFKREVKAGG